MSCPNTSPVSGTASTECPGNTPLRGTLALLPAPIPALLSSPSPTLSLEEPKPKGRKGPSCSPGLTSRQHTLLDPDQHTEQSRRGNAPFGKPPPATLCLGMAPLPPSVPGGLQTPGETQPPSSSHRPSNSFKSGNKYRKIKHCLQACPWQPQGRRILLCKIPNSSRGKDQR